VAVDLSWLASLPGVQLKAASVVSPSAGVVSIWKPLAAPSAPEHELRAVRAGGDIGETPAPEALIFCASVPSVSLLVTAMSTCARLVSAVNAPLATVPKRSVNVPDPTALVEAARLGLTSVCPLASAVTSSVDVPLPVSVPLLTVATALLVIVGSPPDRLRARACRANWPAC
jgi:hypothetical protein